MLRESLGNALVLVWPAFGEASFPPTRENAGVLNMVAEVLPMPMWCSLIAWPTFLAPQCARIFILGASLVRSLAKLFGSPVCAYLYFWGFPGEVPGEAFWLPSVRVSLFFGLPW